MTKSFKLHSAGQTFSIRLRELLIFCIVVFLLQGCETTSQRIPDESEKPSLPEGSGIVLLEEKRHLDAVVVGRVQAYGGGIIGALASIASEQEERQKLNTNIAQVRDELSPYAFEHLADCISAEVRSSNVPLDPENIRILPQEQDQEKQIHNNLVINPHYYFAPDLIDLRLSLEVSFRTGPGKEHLLYRNQFLAVAPCYLNLFVGDSSSEVPEKAVQAVRNAISEIARKAAQMVIDDLNS